MIPAGKSQLMFADIAAIEEKAGFVMIARRIMNAGKKYCCLWSTRRGLGCADIEERIEQGKIRDRYFVE